MALVGVSMVSTSGHGLITDEDEFEAICESIRVSMSKISFSKPAGQEDENSQTVTNHQVNLTDFTVGEAIAKGCNAVVYSAKENRPIMNEKLRFHDYFQSTSKIQASEIGAENLLICNVDNRNDEKIKQTISGNFSEYNLALKMMFNYDAESNAPVIMRAMYKEVVPAKYLMLPSDYHQMCYHLRHYRSLTAHNNIVDMKYVFADRVPVLPEQIQLYPDALPTRLNPTGCGRNMTMFLVMKRYHKSLKDYLESYTPSHRTSLMLLAQLLEGLHHLNMYGICHRDLKTDNLLLDMTDGPESPKLVITDFGCCSLKLSIPFPSIELDQREGNVAMMAPEISTALPGIFAYIDYSKADLWAAGALSYELYGQHNPFYSSTNNGSEQVKKRLDSRTYNEEDLPKFVDDVSVVVQKLVQNMLSREPSKRLNVGVAASVCQLLLFAPKHWLLNSVHPFDDNELMTWLVLLTASCARLHNRENAMSSVKVLDELKQSFLKHVRFTEVCDALRFIRSCF